MSVFVAEYRLAVVYPMIARRCRYDVADVSPTFGQFVVNRYVGQSYGFHSFNSCNSCSTKERNTLIGCPSRVQRVQRRQSVNNNNVFLYPSSSPLGGLSPPPPLPAPPPLGVSGSSATMSVATYFTFCACLFRANCFEYLALPSSVATRHSSSGKPFGSALAAPSVLRLGLYLCIAD